MSDGHGDEGRPDRGTIQEPPSATVDDWLGQQASEDESVVDELLEETGGDVRPRRRSPAGPRAPRPQPARAAWSISRATPSSAGSRSSC